MSRWGNFLDSLDTGGGHIFIAFCILALGTWTYMHIDATAGGQVMTGALTALWVMLKTSKSNREQLGESASAVPLPPPPAAAAGMPPETK